MYVMVFYVLAEGQQIERKEKKKTEQKKEANCYRDSYTVL